MTSTSNDQPSTSLQTDAVIIGAGVIGGAVAFELARRGWRTVSVDKGPAAGHGSTSSSSAIVRFSYSTVGGVSVAWEGLHYWRNWTDYLETDDELGVVSYIPCGMAMFVTPDGGHERRVVPLWDQLGVPYEVWDAEELQRRLPVLDLGIFGPPARPDDDAFWADATGKMVGAVFSPDAGYVSDPQLAAHNLQRAAEAKGATFRFNTEVTGILVDDQRCAGVALADGTTISAPVVVNVAGPHSSQINELAGVADGRAIKTRAVRHEVHQVPAPSSVDFDADGFNIADDDNGIYVRPQTGNNMLIGGTDPACDPKEYIDPDDFNPGVTEDQWQAQVLRANKRIPSLGVPHQRMGLAAAYDVSDDWIPIYDRTDLDGFYVAIGTSGNQFKNAGVAGHMMAELIEAVEAGHDHDADPLVVTARFTGLDLDLATFARNREVHNSSMTVHG